MPQPRNPPWETWSLGQPRIGYCGAAAKRRPPISLVEAWRPPPPPPPPPPPDPPPPKPPPPESENHPPMPVPSELPVPPFLLIRRFVANASAKRPKSAETVCPRFTLGRPRSTRAANSGLSRLVEGPYHTNHVGR